MIVMSYRPLLVTRRSCIVPTALDSLSFAAVLCVIATRDINEHRTKII
ncbi:hypothetical protein QWZ13_18165 [Reinekea marina]|nr:hypothetical protein [Reinekea marina]MDN3650836.1 hypothetical protein [Reinekea marina]